MDLIPGDVIRLIHRDMRAHNDCDGRRFGYVLCAYGSYGCHTRLTRGSKNPRSVYRTSEGNRRPVESYSPLVCKNFRRNCSGGRGREGKVPPLNSRRCREVLSRVRVRENNCTRGVQPFVAIGVVKVPMRVDEVLDRIGAD